MKTKVKWKAFIAPDCCNIPIIREGSTDAPVLVYGKSMSHPKRFARKLAKLMTAGHLLPLFLFLCLTSIAATPSYWWNQMLVKPDSKQSQEFWFVPGQGVFFSYATNHVIINAGSGTNAGITTNLCVVFCDGSTNLLNFTNGLLMAVNHYPTPVVSAIIQPAGLGYLIQPGGGKLLLP